MAACVCKPLACWFRLVTTAETDCPEEVPTWSAAALTEFSAVDEALKAPCKAWFALATALLMFPVSVATCPSWVRSCWASLDPCPTRLTELVTSPLAPSTKPP